MSKTKDQKKEIVAVITEKLQRSKSVVFTDYQGLTMAQLSVLRTALSDQQAEFSITKNTLLKLSLESNPQYKVDDISLFQGPIATLFSFEDEITPIKSLVKALKEAQVGKIKAGFLGPNFLDADSINKLATLPSKLELQAKVVGSLAAPLYGMVNVLQANLRNLVYALDQIRISRGGEQS